MALAAASSGDVIEQFTNILVSGTSTINLIDGVTWQMNGYEYKNNTSNDMVMFTIPTNTTVKFTFKNGTIVKISKNDTSIDKQVESGRLYKDGKIIIYDYESPSNVRSKISFTGLIIISLVLQNNKIKSKPIVKIIGLPEFDKEGIRLSDWVNQALDNVISSKNKSGNLESKIKNAVIRQIREVWGKKPKVEIIFH